MQIRCNLSAATPDSLMSVPEKTTETAPHQEVSR